MGYFALLKKLLVLVLLSGFMTGGFSRVPSSQEDSVTQKFYALNHHQLFWFSSGRGIKRASEWINTIESAANLGIVADREVLNKCRTSLLSRNSGDGNYKESADRQITGLVLSFLKELQQGNIRLDYDEISHSRDTLYMEQLLNSKNRESASKMAARLDCRDPAYLVLKDYLKDSVPASDTLKKKLIVQAMNWRRYLTINHQREYILVNIPETEAGYYRNDSLVISMKTVVGRKKSPTPLIASYITSVVTFPHWNVPYTIAVTELLPKVQKDESYLEQANFEIVNAKGNVVDDTDLNWADYDARNFPYFFRQSTGAENSLGVLKFNLQNPFSIFLHSTSQQAAFAKDFRFLSHGCIRLEKPFELAEALLRGNIDIAELKKGKENTETKTIKLPVKVPVFIIYMPVKVEGKKITLLRDVYGLIK